MKKFLSVFIMIVFCAGVFVWVFRPISLNQETNYVSSEDFIQQIADRNLAELSHEEKRELARIGGEYGVEIDFRNDGSIMLTNEDGFVIRINPDGTWVFNDVDSDGFEFRQGGNFPINNLTRLIPIPSFTIDVFMGDDEYEYTLLSYDVTLSQIQDYIEQVRNKGFTINVEKRNSARMFRFVADDSNGNTVEIMHSDNKATITIQRP